MVPHPQLNLHLIFQKHIHHPNITHERGRENTVKIKRGWGHFPICLCSESTNEPLTHFTLHTSKSAAGTK